MGRWKRDEVGEGEACEPEEDTPSPEGEEAVAGSCWEDVLAVGYGDGDRDGRTRWLALALTGLCALIDAVRWWEIEW